MIYVDDMANQKIICPHCQMSLSKSEISYTSVRFCETKQEKNGYLIPFNLIKTDEHETGLSLLDQKKL